MRGFGIPDAIRILIETALLIGCGLLTPHWFIVAFFVVVTIALEMISFILRRGK